MIYMPQGVAACLPHKHKMNNPIFVFIVINGNEGQQQFINKDCVSVSECAMWLFQRKAPPLRSEFPWIFLSFRLSFLFARHTSNPNTCSSSEKWKPSEKSFRILICSTQRPYTLHIHTSRIFIRVLMYAYFSIWNVHAHTHTNTNVYKWRDRDSVSERKSKTIFPLWLKWNEN